MYETQEERDAFYNSSKWRNFRLKILKRDNYECLHCKARGLVTTTDKRLIVDHIKELKDYPELALDPDNLRTLCHACHEKRHDRAWSGQVSAKSKQWDDEWY